MGCMCPDGFHAYNTRVQRRVNDCCFPQRIKHLPGMGSEVGGGILVLLVSHSHQVLGKKDHMIDSSIRTALNGVEIFPKKKRCQLDKYRCPLR